MWSPRKAYRLRHLPTLQRDQASPSVGAKSSTSGRYAPKQPEGVPRATEKQIERARLGLIMTNRPRA
jgi:hypothetical protein